MVFLENMWVLTYNLSFYLLLGAFAAGVLHLFVSERYIRHHLGKSSVGSVLKAALFGIPLPFCSCSVVPFAVSLKKSGASDGAVLSFLISTPITGADSIAATYGVFGGLFTAYRVVTSLIIALIAGVLTNLFGLPARVESVASQDGPDNTEEPIRERRFKSALAYGFNSVFKDIARPLTFGIILGGIITTFIPADLGILADKYYLLTYLTIILIAPPLYICATSSIPVAASLITVGVPVGAAFVLLSAGPATSTVTMSIVYQNLGRRIFGIYLSVILVSSIIFGMLLDRILDATRIDIKNLLTEHKDDTGVFVLSSILLISLLTYYVIIEPLKKRFGKKPDTGCNSGSCGCGH